MRNSQAWAETVKSTGIDSEVAHPLPGTQPTQGVQPFDSLRVPAPGPSDSGAPSITPSSTNLSHGTPSVADLLSQLQATQVPASSSNSAQGSRILDPPPAPSDNSNTSSTSNSSSGHTPPPNLDVRALSFQQSLAHISRLGEDSNVISELLKVITSIRYHTATSYDIFSSKMKQEQDKLEKQLWEERLDIQKRHEKKVKVETTKCAKNPICFPFTKAPIGQR